MTNCWTLLCLHCEAKEGLKIALTRLSHAKRLHFGPQGQISIPSSDFERWPPQFNQGCFVFFDCLSSSSILCSPQSSIKVTFIDLLVCDLYRQALNIGSQHNRRPQITVLGLGICSEVGGLVRHEAEMLTKCIFLLMKRFLRVSRASYLLRAFISTMGGLCSPACWWSLLFWGGDF